MPNRATEEIIKNQVFLGLPWKNVRPHYEKAIEKLEKKYPLAFTIVGRSDSQNADDLLEVIKTRIRSSSYAIFDATGGNANVSLEFGYAEALDIPRVIYLSVHGAAHQRPTGSIISDLSGRRRVQYTTEPSLISQLDAFCREHDFTKRFEKTLTTSFGSLRRGRKKSLRALTLKTIHYLTGKARVRRDDLVQHLEALGYPGKDIEAAIKSLHNRELIIVDRGRYSTVRIG